MPGVGGMLDELRRVLEEDQDIAYALLFGSGGRGTLRPTSDVDVAVELRPGAPRDTVTLGLLAARLESAAGRPVDLVLMDVVPAPLAYRIFRDGRVLLEQDHAALVRRKAQAILQYLDFKPVEEQCAEGVLRAAAGRG
jgi:predicted nucleotidyltransferase